MTTEIEKLYENAGIKPLPTCNNCSMLDEYWSNGTYCSTCKYDKDKDECNMVNYLYPPFTAEKQLELIKWIARKGLIQINYSSHQCYQFNSFRIGGDYKADISEALASHYNNLWQYLTKEERKQIKEILA